MNTKDNARDISNLIEGSEELSIQGNMVAAHGRALQALRLILLRLKRIEADVWPLSVSAPTTNLPIKHCDCQDCESARRHAKKKPVIMDGHEFGCPFYSAVSSGACDAGICTCGYGWQQSSRGDHSQRFSKERSYS